jgi:8-oxo-dGTP pyrophosphatase MutT (NUDIX family)
LADEFPLPIPAATVVLVRDSAEGLETLMLRRNAHGSFGGMWVFPGGRVDAADREADASWCDGIDHAARQLDGLAPAEAVAYHVAAARELFEEAGVLLARHPNGDFVSLAAAADHERLRQDRALVHEGKTSLRAVIEREGLRLALDELVLFAHWVTPPIDTRQFDTRYFMARLPPHQTPAHDDTETTHSLWVRPADAIAQSIKDEIVLPPPTWSTLRELEPFESVKDALAWARRRTVVRRMPRAIEQDGHRMLVLPGDPLHPDPAGDEPPAETRFLLIDGRWRAERPPT